MNNFCSSSFIFLITKFNLIFLQIKIDDTNTSLPKLAHFFPIFIISSAVLFTFISLIPLKVILFPPICITATSGSWSLSWGTTYCSNSCILTLRKDLMKDLAFSNDLLNLYLLISLYVAFYVFPTTIFSIISSISITTISRNNFPSWCFTLVFYLSFCYAMFWSFSFCNVSVYVIIAFTLVSVSPCFCFFQSRLAIVFIWTFPRESYY